MSQYEQLTLFDLTAAVRATAERIADGELFNAQDKLDLAEQMYEARRRMPANQEYGAWWRSIGIDYSYPWRATLVGAGKRIAADGRPVLNQVKDGGEFSIRRYADTGDGWITGWITGDDEPAEQDPPTTNGDEYYTPAWIFERLNITFDLDVCAPTDRTHVTTPTDRFYTIDDDGLTTPWHGRVWMNPPYSKPAPWVERFITHHNGIALLPFAKSQWFFDLWNSPATIAAPGIDASKFIGGPIFMPVMLVAVGPVENHDAVRRAGVAR